MCSVTLSNKNINDEKSSEAKDMQYKLTDYKVANTHQPHDL